MLTGVINWFNDHPLVKVVTVVAGLVGAGATFTKLAYDQKLEAANTKLEQTKLDYEERIADLEASLSNIERTIGGKTDVLDVAGMVVDQDDASKLARATYYSAERYYALDERVESDWRLRQTDEWRLLVETLGPEQAAAFVKEFGGPGAAKHLRTLTVRAWRKDEPHRVLMGGELPQEFTLYPQVMVERLTGASIDEMLPAGERVYDRAGLILVQQLSLQLGFQQQARARLVSLQKRENAGYARYESAFQNVRINGKPFKEYFLTQEIVVIRTDNDDVYLIKTSLPRAEPRNADAAWVTRWFDAFHIVSE